MRETLLAVWTIARWEVARSITTMSRDVLPIAIALFVLLVAVTGFASQSGVHLQDGMYNLGIDDPGAARIFAGDERFAVYQADAATLMAAQGTFDLIIIDGRVSTPETEKGRSALRALSRDYTRYEAFVFNQQEDLFAAYPLWIDSLEVKSELDFIATQSGQPVGAGLYGRRRPVPDGPVLPVAPPSATIDVSREDLRRDLIAGAGTDSQISRYSDILSPDTGPGTFKTPSQLSPPLPFDSIILVFVFIFPLYFTSQFFMMSIMNERVERRGEILLSTPLKPWQIIVGKALPYLVVMLGVSAILALINSAPLIILLPLLPVILFFLANALIIGMVARSFKELSFVSIFFSTIATSYLFFPSIFANVHVISLISPLTLIVLQMQGDGFTATDYMYSTSLFWLTSAVLFYVGTVNFTEERLFTLHTLTTRIREFIGTSISLSRPYTSLFLISLFSIPFVFMAQLMMLVLLFNLPMPLSLIVLLVGAAFIEELAKSIGVYTLVANIPDFFSWKRVVAASAAVAAGFLIGEKTLLFATLAQISDSIFGAVLFASLQVLWIPLTLHFIGIFVTAAVLRTWGRRAYLPGLIAATVIHTLYNLSFILGWI
ncbi:MAG: PrsW family intramembrane metalloprotease [Methanomicrobiaceae archaeon]|nr:PrsW family intramembrane metalloprotease [Methanomicrobiaceae archaeon]